MESKEEQGQDCNFPEKTTMKKKTGLHVVVLRCVFVLLFPIFAFLSLSFLIGFVALFFGKFSITTPISVPSQCRIISSSVDLRSSKVCELGLLNYNAKHVFYPSERKRFRCHFDYYWASIFKVEYKDHLSGEKQFALAEAPNEALPLDCRPDFASAFLTKDKFKVNESYNCWYTYGFSKVNIYPDNFFSCHAQDPSFIEMIRRYYILFTRIMISWFSNTGIARSWKWESVAGIITGVTTPLISISIVRVLHHIKSLLPRFSSMKIYPLSVYGPRMKRACFLVAYFSFMGWLAIQYGKKVGLVGLLHY